jgi:hypothetical protein
MASRTRIWTKISTWMVKLYYYDTVNRNAEMVVSSVQIAKSFNNKKRAEDTGVLVDTFQICSRRTDRTPDRALMASPPRTITVAFHSSVPNQIHAQREQSLHPQSEPPPPVNQTTSQRETAKSELRLPTHQMDPRGQRESPRNPPLAARRN